MLWGRHMTEDKLITFEDLKKSELMKEVDRNFIKLLRILVNE